MYVMVNGERQQHPDQTTLACLLGRLKIRPERVATMVNNEVIPRNQRQRVVLMDGDRVELVAFAGGG